MLKSSLAALTVLVMTLPTVLLADDNMAILESVVTANARVQPGLQHYVATVETSRVAEIMTHMTSGMPVDVTPPPTPVITKFWQRDGKSLIFAQQSQLNASVDKMIKQLLADLAVELNEMMLPAARAEQRRELVQDADIKLSEVALADNLINRLEITFAKPTDLDEAFYGSGMLLPQKQVVSLGFDIDNKTNTVSELLITTADGLRLSLEIRYIAVAGGQTPERFQITSPDGIIDERFEVKFTEVDSYLLPASMLRIIRRPDQQDDLEVLFKNYQVNQPIPEDIQSRLKAQ
jgi:hypothetical protein